MYFFSGVIYEYESNLGKFWSEKVQKTTIEETDYKFKVRRRRPTTIKCSAASSRHRKKLLLDLAKVDVVDILYHGEVARAHVIEQPEGTSCARYINSCGINSPTKK